MVRGRVPTSAITRERLGRWRRVFRDNEATPILLVGVGFNEHAGETVMCVPEELPTESIVTFLEAALAALKSGEAHRVTHHDR